MDTKYQEIYNKLHKIYQKHRKKYKHNPDSKQMCCMWATINPPDILEGTPPYCDIENAFDIELDEYLALELYDMMLEEATLKIAEILKKNEKKLQKKKQRIAKIKKKLNKAEKGAKKEAKAKRQKEYMWIFRNGKQVKVKRPPTIDGMSVEEFIENNADPLWLHQNEMWENIPFEAIQWCVIETDKNKIPFKNSKNNRF